MSSSVQVYPESFRGSLVGDLQELGFDLNKTNLTMFKQKMELKRCEGSYRTAIHVRGSYPSAAAILCPVLVRVFTCCWCCCLRPTADKTPIAQRNTRESPLKRRVDRMIHGSSAANHDGIEPWGHPKQPVHDNEFLPGAATQEQIWDRNRAIGKSGWYSAWGTAPYLVFTTKGDVINKHRAEISTEATYSPEFDKNAITVGCMGRQLLCKEAGEKCGTPGFLPSCFGSFTTWLIMIMLLPAVVIAFVSDAFIVPSMLFIGVIVAMLVIDPFAYAFGCCCGMRSSRGAVLLASLQHRYNNSSGLDGSSSNIVDEVIAEVVLAERISVVKACCLQAHASNPWMSSYQYLVRNPVWGMFEPGVPVEEIAAAWTELIKRVGGQIPQTHCSQDSWSNGHKC